MLKIRLARAGKKDSPFYRVVLTEHTAAPQHGYKKVLWFYNPFTKEFSLKDLETVKKYVGHWAQMSSRVAKLVKSNNIDL